MCRWYGEYSAASSSRKPTPPSDLLPILEEDDWEWHHCNGQESQETRGPLITQLLVHLHAEEREDGCRI